MPLMIDLPEEAQKALAEKARAAGLSVELYAKQVLTQGLRASDLPADLVKPAIWDIIAERASRLPAEVANELPEDAASRVDDYLYGEPDR